MGLVNRVVPDDELEAYVKNYAETIAANAPLTVNAVKFIVGEVVKDESKRDLARCAELVAACFASNDYIEGRRPSWRSASPFSRGRDQQWDPFVDRGNGDVFGDRSQFADRRKVAQG